jgi:hypothetical protein
MISVSLTKIYIFKIECQSKVLLAEPLGKPPD